MEGRIFISSCGLVETGMIRRETPTFGCAHSLAEVEHLKDCGASRTIMGEAEIARAMLALCGKKGEEPAPSTPNAA